MCCCHHFSPKFQGVAGFVSVQNLEEQKGNPFSALDIAPTGTEGDADLGHSCQLSLSVHLRIHDSSFSTSNPLKRIIEDEILAHNSRGYENSAVDPHLLLCDDPSIPPRVLGLLQE